jgi:hypothetical protein
MKCIAEKKLPKQKKNTKAQNCTQTKFMHSIVQPTTIFSLTFDSRFPAENSVSGTFMIIDLPAVHPDLIIYNFLDLENKMWNHDGDRSWR